MTEPTAYIDERKKAQLDALAAGGQRALAEYEKATTAVNTAQQGSIDAALADSRIRGAGAPAEAEIGRIIGQGSAPGLAEMEKRRDFTGYLGGIQQGIEGTYMDALKATIPALEAELAASGSGGGGGGGGGGGRGGSGGGDEDWWDPLSEDFDTKSDLYNWIELQPGEGRLPAFLMQRAIAAELGIPEGTIEARFQPSDWLQGGLARGTRMAQNFDKSLGDYRRKIKRMTPAVDRQRLAPERRYMVDQFRAQREALAAAIATGTAQRNANRSRRRRSR